jgi:TrmH family RNA methyltransferase
VAAISSRHNPRFRDALALRDARDRRRLGRLLVDGAREVRRALEAGVTVREAWVAAERLDPQAHAAVLALEGAGVDVVPATPDLVDRLAFGQRHEGLVAVVDAPPARLADLRPTDDPLLVVLDGVEKPGNVGAVVRSADGAGADAVILADPLSDPWNPNAVRASLGTVFGVPLAVCPAAEALDWLRQHGVAIVTARVDGTLDYDRVDMTGPTALVLGSEARGLEAAWSGPDITTVRIPMLGRADSLNVSVTAAILLYEARRQRRAARGAVGA